MEVTDRQIRVLTRSTDEYLDCRLFVEQLGLTVSDPVLEGDHLYFIISVTDWSITSPLQEWLKQRRMEHVAVSKFDDLWTTK
jgi:hypothetical protein